MRLPMKIGNEDNQGTQSQERKDGMDGSVGQAKGTG